VRGKLRDKRSDLRQERIKRELIERHRPPKRDSRITLMHMQELEEGYLFEEEEAQLLSVNKHKKNK
jgi:hypothetical protein